MRRLWIAAVRAIRAHFGNAIKNLPEKARETSNNIDLTTMNKPKSIFLGHPLFSILLLILF